MNTTENKQEKYNINTESGQVDFPTEDKETSIFEENGTFCRVGSIDGGILEIDLRTSKQRGQEERFLVFSAMGLNEQNEASKTDVFILDEKLFSQLKSFIAKLNWND